jgi:hypothetical protein
MSLPNMYRRVRSTFQGDILYYATPHEELMARMKNEVTMSNAADLGSPDLVELLPVDMPPMFLPSS